MNWWTPRKAERKAHLVNAAELAMLVNRNRRSNIVQTRHSKLTVERIVAWNDQRLAWLVEVSWLNWNRLLIAAFNRSSASYERLRLIIQNLFGSIHLPIERETVLLKSCSMNCVHWAIDRLSFPSKTPSLVTDFNLFWFCLLMFSKPELYKVLDIERGRGKSSLPKAEVRILRKF